MGQGLRFVLTGLAAGIAMAVAASLLACALPAARVGKHVANALNAE